jgi:non-ribosomal peptide synthase protein (TIGR01720 family)
VDYGALRYLAQDETTRARLAAMPVAEVGFNYLGQFDSALTYPFMAMRPAGHGDSHDLMEIRSHLIEITGMVEAGALRLEWNFSRALHRRETLQWLADSAMENLQALLAKGERGARSPRGSTLRGRESR